MPKFSTIRSVKRFVAAYEGPCNVFDPAACLRTIVDGDYCGFIKGVSGPSCSECCDSAEGYFARQAAV